MTPHCQSPLRGCLALLSPLLTSHSLFSLLQSDFYTDLYPPILAGNQPVTSSRLSRLVLISHDGFAVLMLFSSSFLLKHLFFESTHSHSPSASQSASRSYLQPFKCWIFLLILPKTSPFLTHSLSQQFHYQVWGEDNQIYITSCPCLGVQTHVSGCTLG